jgi:Cu(I)/Ag(I) efflux system membrane fusion protein
VTKYHLQKEIRAVGKVAFDPELATAQEEYISALNTAETISNADQATASRVQILVQNAAYKLRLLGMDNTEIEDLQRTGKGDISLIIPENEACVYADVYESDIAWVKKGQQVFVTSIAYPGEEFTGTVKSISPVLNSQTRSATVRIHIFDKTMRLKPGMYVDTKVMAMYTPSSEILKGSRSKHEVLVIPRESVLDTGNRKVVWVYLGDGQFQPREVTLGPEGSIRSALQNERYYPVLDGLKENELVVTNGNFLVDSESRITGVAAISYGGALGVEAKPQVPQVHQH